MTSKKKQGKFVVDDYKRETHETRITLPSLRTFEMWIRRQGDQYPVLVIEDCTKDDIRDIRSLLGFIEPWELATGMAGDGIHSAPEGFSEYGVGSVECFMFLRRRYRPIDAVGTKDTLCSLIKEHRIRIDYCGSIYLMDTSGLGSLKFDSVEELYAHLNKRRAK